MTKSRLFACSLLLFSSINNAFAAPPATAKEEYELQERCGKLTAQIFKKEFGAVGMSKIKDGTVAQSYRNHYNKRLNKCFVIFSTTTYPSNSLKQNPFKNYQLYDINENNLVGELMVDINGRLPLPCYVGENKCDSEKSWEALAVPYMND